MTPAARLEALTSLYERRAYVVWNVALRTVMEEEGARAAARRAFLTQVADPAEERLDLEAARFGAEAAAPVDPRQVEGEILAATAQLAPVQRAALALDELAEATTEDMASALGIDALAAEDLLGRAREQLATLLGVPAAEAGLAYAELPWAEPPPELWEGLYPELHTAVTRHARESVQSSHEESPAPAPRSAATGLTRVRRVALAVVAALALAGVAWATTGGGDDDGGESAGLGGYDAPLGGSAAPADGDTATGDPATTAPALTPEELDELRQEEIEALKRFTRRKADKRLAPRQRRQAARKVGALVRLAQARQRAAERRELAVRRALAREREARIRERNRRQETASRDPEPAPEREREREQPSNEEPPSQDARPRDKPEPRDDASRDDEAQAECLYDAGSGSYICPE